MYKLVYVTSYGTFELEYDSNYECHEKLKQIKKEQKIISWLIIGQDQSVIDEG